MEKARAIYCFAVRPKEALGGGGQEARRLAAEARALGLERIRAVRRAALYFVSGSLAPKELDLLGRFLLSDPLAEDCSCELRSHELRSQELRSQGPSSPGAAQPRIEVALRPGVTDPVAEEIMRAASELGIGGLEAASTGEAFEVEAEGALGAEELDLLARRLLANPVIQRYAIGRIEPSFLLAAAASPPMESFPLGEMDDGALLALSAERRTALELEELSAIRSYFAKEGRPCTDVELETLAQTWSEHCVHKTFKARIEVRDPAASGPGGSPYPPLVDNVLKTYIKKASDEIAAPWVLSSFVDNAGVIALDEGYEVSFKVETHNHPSAVEPFGGANTGVGGVIRDVMGVSARPVAVTDVLCFGPPDTPLESLRPGLLHPRRVASGVVAGVEDYGNKMGIPTVNGGVHYDPGYAASPLVYCGCAGIAPRGARRREAAAGDRVVVIGGRTGRDGIRGATFSSMVMDASTGDLAGASVQIGAPIVQRKAAEVLVMARDRGLYSAVTDCGAGGLSSAVGEMAEVLGADVDLSLLPLKYPGLASWEIWLSEAQERMVLAVPPGKLPELKELCASWDVELTDMGAFTGDGRLLVRRGKELAVDLDCSFLHSGLPQRRLVAAPPPAGARPAASDRAALRPTALSPASWAEALRAVLAHPAVASKEETVRRYDHEVQGATVLRPYDGLRADGPQDGAVLAPRECGGKRGFSLSNGFNPRYGAADPHGAAVSAVDEAIRNAVAVGADPDRVALLDNFCLGDPKRPETMWALLEAARGCYEEAVAQGAPYISGKDSFNNEYLGPDGAPTSIPPSLLISAIGIVPDPAAVPGSDLKAPGDALYLVGDFEPRLGASAYASLYATGEAGPPVPASPPRAHEVYRALHAAIAEGRVRACHDLSDGGLGAAVAEMCIGGRLGASVDLRALGRPGEPPAALALFGETNGCLLVEVGPADRAAFEAGFAGLPSALIGAVKEGEVLSFEAGLSSFSLPLGDLVESFSGKRRAE